MTHKLKSWFSLVLFHDLLQVTFLRLNHVLDGYYLVGRGISALSLPCCLMACCMFEGSVTHKESVHVLNMLKQKHWHSCGH